jgi:endogenous inhibitor of DNA gyrase (YacG/DUF329 family)
VSEPRCVYCRKHPVEPTWRPFCSERCKLLDLARWVDGDYRIPDDASKERDDDGATDEA